MEYLHALGVVGFWVLVVVAGLALLATALIAMFITLDCENAKDFFITWLIALPILYFGGTAYYVWMASLAT